MARVDRLLEASQTEEQAWARYAQWQTDATFRAVPELAAFLEGMTVPKFARVVAFLRSPLGQGVRTNNHGKPVSTHGAYSRRRPHELTPAF